MSRHQSGLLRLTFCVLLFWGISGQAQSIVINEFMASNATTIADDDGDFSDWIELFNPGSEAFDLTDCYLSDDADEPLRWRFPGGSVPPQGHLLVWASGKDRVSPGGELHTNFAISASGEPLLLSGPDGETRLDEVPAVTLPADISYGRLTDGAASWVQFAIPTPGTANDGGLLQLRAPHFSSAPGFHTGAIMLALASDDPEVEIRYTLDGSEPTLASPLYESPLALDTRTGDANFFSLIPTNFRDPAEGPGWRPPLGEVFKLNVVRTRAFRSGLEPSAITTGSFIVDPDLAGRFPFPVVSLATHPDNFFDDVIGIYVPGVHYVEGNNSTGNYYQRGEAWERPLHVEIFDHQGDLILAQDAGVRIHGGFIRHFPQKSLRLYARSQYGTARFDGALFPERPHDSYNRFLIRNSGNDWTALGFRDLAVQTMCAGMGLDTQVGRPVVHFVNGEYWGLANLRERLDCHYLARIHAMPDDEVALLVNNATLEEGSPADQADYLALREFVSTQDMTLPASLAHVSAQMDIENFLAYQVAQIVIANHDWPGNNIRFWRRTQPSADSAAPPSHDGRWRWLVYDLDMAFIQNSVAHNTLAHATAVDGPTWPNPPWSTALLRGLLENPDVRAQFINTCADHLNSTFRPQRLIDIIDGFADLYFPGITEWYARWDAYHPWHASVENLRNFANQRPAHVRQHFVAGFGLGGLTQVTLDVNDPAAGSIQLNQLVIDSNLSGLVDPAQPYPWTGTYFQDVPLTITALPAPGYRFDGWHGQDGADAQLTLIPGAAPIVLTAVFTRDQTIPVPLHAWHFNDLPADPLLQIAADVSAVAGGSISYPGTGAGYLDRVDDGTDHGALHGIAAGQALRVRNPADTRELLVVAPTPGYTDLTLSYAARRTTNGAETHSVYCEVTAGGPWHLIAENIEISEEYAIFSHDLAAISGTADNPQLVLRFVFGGASAGATTGNQRLDNMILAGFPITGPDDPPPSLPDATAVQATVPNPFNETTTISFSVRAGESARLDIFNGRGQRVRRLGTFAPGQHQVSWDGSDDQDRRCASGVYFCRLAGASGSQARKILLLK